MVAMANGDGSGDSNGVIGGGDDDQNQVDT